MLVVLEVILEASPPIAEPQCMEAVERPCTTLLDQERLCMDHKPHCMMVQGRLIMAQ